MTDQTPSQYLKENGIKGIKELSEISQVSRQTLGNWYREKPELFRLLMMGAKAHKDKAVSD